MGSQSTKCCCSEDREALFGSEGKAQAPSNLVNADRDAPLYDPTLAESFGGLENPYMVGSPQQGAIHKSENSAALRKNPSPFKDVMREHSREARSTSKESSPEDAKKKTNGHKEQRFMPSNSTGSSTVVQSMAPSSLNNGGQSEKLASPIGSRLPNFTGVPEAGNELQEWENRLKELRQLCYAVRIFDASKLLLECEGKFANLKPAADVLRTDELFKRLRRHNARLRAGLKLLELMPSKPVDDDKRWAKYFTPCPDLHADCKMELICRFLEGRERESQGSATQFVVVFKSVNLPVTIAQQATIYAAVDKFDMAWDSSLKAVEGTPGGREKFHSCMFRKHFKAPIRFASENEIVVLRDFAVCEEGPISSLGPGLLILGGPPEYESWEGWTTPDPTPGLSRSTSQSCDYVMPGDHPDTSHLSFVLKMELPIPQYMFTKSLALKLIGGSARTISKNMRDKCWSRFGLVPGMKESMERMEEFMVSLGSLSTTEAYKRTWTRASRVSME